jgi:hypothetical protein
LEIWWPDWLQTSGVRVWLSMLRAPRLCNIHPYNNATQTRWDRGEFKVQLRLPNNPRAIGFCDGSPEDIAELRSIGEAEGADDVSIHKKHLKSGREVWTLGGSG